MTAPGLCIRTATGTAALAAIAVLGGACSDGPRSATAHSGPDRPVVVATTGIWADVVANVACGGLADVRTVIPAGADPHAFEPSMRDRATLSDASLVVANGLGLEESLRAPLAAVADEGVPVFEVGRHVRTIPVAGGAEAGSDHGTGSGHGGADPHIWQDPTRVREAIPALAEVLVKDAGLDRAKVDACAAAYTAELTALDQRTETTLGGVPEARRKLVTSHDALGYLAARYGYEVIGTVIPSASTMAQTNPADIERLAGLISSTGVPAVFAETQHSAADTEALARRVGDIEVVTLSTDTLGEPGSGSDTYVGLMDTNARLIADALVQGR